MFLRGKVQRLFKHFWVITPVKSKITNISLNGFTIYDRGNLVAGSTELGAEGKVFFDLCHRNSSLYDHSLWIFATDCFENQDEAYRFSRILRVIAEAMFDFEISNPGLLIINQETGEYIVKQPPNLQRRNSIRQNDINEVELKRLFDMCRGVMSLDSEKTDYFESIFDYLCDIRRSPLFVSELALWSFLEHHWADNKTKINIRKSLKSLLDKVCDRDEKKEFNKKITAVGKDLGGEYNEHVLRNILAHGKHITLREKWTDENWTNFHEVHDELFSLIIRGIARQIY